MERYLRPAPGMLEIQETAEQPVWTVEPVQKENVSVEQDIQENSAR